MTEGKGKYTLALSWDKLRLTRRALTKRVDCSTGEAQMEEAGGGVAVEDAGATNMGLMVLCQGCVGNHESDPSTCRRPSLRSQVTSDCHKRKWRV